MVLLKDGSSVDDGRLDFLPQKDERSRLYKAVDLLDEKKLRYRDWFPDIWLNQGEEGACVAFAIFQELACSPVRYREGITDENAFSFYHEVQHRDPWPGCEKGLYCPIEPSREQYGGTSLLAGLQLAKSRGMIDSYRWAFGEQDLALSLSNLGPAVIGIAWYDSMYRPDPVTNTITIAGRKVGGHAIVVAGFDPLKERYKLWNSWGEDYGISGWCYISRGDMERLLKDNGEAAIPIKRVAK